MLWVEAVGVEFEAQIFILHVCGWALDTTRKQIECNAISSIVLQQRSKIMQQWSTNRFHVSSLRILCYSLVWVQGI